MAPCQKIKFNLILCGEKIGNIFCSFESWQPGSLINFIFLGKRWVECQKKQQISIPDNIDPETQVISRCITSQQRYCLFTAQRDIVECISEYSVNIYLEGGKRSFVENIKLIVASGFNKLKCKIHTTVTTLTERKFASKSFQLF